MRKLAAKPAADAEEEENKETPERVCVNACVTAHKTLVEAWVAVKEHCEGSEAALGPAFEEATAVADVELTRRKAEKAAEAAAAGEGEKEEGSEEGDDEADDEEGSGKDEEDEEDEEDEKDDEERKIDDSYLSQWVDTIMRQVREPLAKALHDKADDEEKEASIRTSARCLYSIAVAFVSAIQCERMRRGLAKYNEASRAYDDAKKAHDEGNREGDEDGDGERKEEQPKKIEKSAGEDGSAAAAATAAAAASAAAATAAAATTDVAAADDGQPKKRAAAAAAAAAAATAAAAAAAAAVAATAAASSATAATAAKPDLPVLDEKESEVVLSLEDLEKERDRAKEQVRVSQCRILLSVSQYLARNTIQSQLAVVHVFMCSCVHVC